MVVRSETMKFLEERSKLLDIGLGHNGLDLTTKAKVKEWKCITQEPLQSKGNHEKAATQ